MNFMRAAAPHLVPILLEQLLKQEEGQEQDDAAWNVAVAAGTCLGLTARVVQDDIVPMVSKRGGGSHGLAEPPALVCSRWSLCKRRQRWLRLFPCICHSVGLVLLGSKAHRARPDSLSTRSK